MSLDFFQKSDFYLTISYVAIHISPRWG